MTSAYQAIPALLVALAILVIPGTAVMVVLRVRGLTAVALTPAMSISIVGVSAVVGPLIGLRWSWLVVAVGLAVVLIALLVLRRLAPVLANAVASTKVEAGPLKWALAGVTVAAVAITARFLLAIDNPEQFTQNYDTVFHLNSVRYILEEGNASSWFVNEFTRPDAGAPAFYPAVWQGLVSLLIQLTGISIPVATNVMWLAGAAVVWPLSAVFLTRILVGARPVVLAAAGVLSAAFAAFPLLLLQYGTVYPNGLSTSLLPIGVALTLVILKQGRESPLPPVAAWLLLVLYLPSQVLSQPNGIFSIAFLLTPLLLILLVRWLRAGFDVSNSNGRRRILLALVIAAVGSVLFFTNPTIQALATWANPQTMPFIEALWRAAANFPVPAWTPAIVLTALVLGGLILLGKRDGRGWLTVTWVMVVIVYGLAIGSANSVGNALISPWYGNPDRLASIMPVIGVPLAAVGIEWLVNAAHRKSGWAVLKNNAPFMAMAAAVVVAAASPPLWQLNARTAMAFTIPTTPDESKQLDTDELALLVRLDELAPEDAVLANNPWNGSALAVALADRDVLYPYMTMTAMGADRTLLSKRLDDVGTSSRVCDAAQRVGVTHLLDFGDDLISASENEGARAYPGIDGAAESGAFELIAAEGHAKLYRLKDCD
ncbi:DUF6541 family protein [Arthrobacter roseus]|uniref:DUF6541 family protein n=1 Tax=Arthrobacter roseus TaxID=136274 RepID=UPI0019629987|nr:DUF6541 family protein [Arthrobacter roseus]MBM7847724.1 hypothetical protein [Arthrobacter roseus]